MKKRLSLLLLLFPFALISQQNYEIKYPTDSTFQLEIWERGQRNSENKTLTQEVNDTVFLRQIFGRTYLGYGRFANAEVNRFIQERESKRLSKLINNDLDTAYFDMTADLFYTRFSGIWRLRVDSLVEKVELVANNKGKIRLKTIAGYESQLLPLVGVNLRMNVFAENSLEIKDLLGTDVKLYHEDMFQQSEKDENIDSEMQRDLEEEFRYISMPSDARKIVLKKLVHIEVEEE